MLDSIFVILLGAFKIIFLRSSSFFFVSTDGSIIGISVIFILLLFDFVDPLFDPKSVTAFESKEDDVDKTVFVPFLIIGLTVVEADVAVEVIIAERIAAIFALAADVLVAYFCVPSSLESIGSFQSDSLNPLSWQSTTPPLHA